MSVDDLPGDRGSEIDPMMLHVHVAWVTEGHKVVERVRVVSICELAHRPDVVNIVRPTIRRGAASTAEATVALPCGSFRSVPRRRQGRDDRRGECPQGAAPVSSAHVRQLRPGLRRSGRRSTAQERGDVLLHAVLQHLPPRREKPGLARWASRILRSGSVRVRTLDHAPCGPFATSGVMAGTRAERASVFRAQHMGRRANDRLAAGGARGLGRRRPLLCPERVRAGTGTRGLSPELQPSGVCFVGCSAHWTLARDGLDHGVILPRDSFMSKESDAS
jgi:hypothetical protein